VEEGAEDYGEDAVEQYVEGGAYLGSLGKQGGRGVSRRVLSNC